jgi:hypothetical protein
MIAFIILTTLLSLAQAYHCRPRHASQVAQLKELAYNRSRAGFLGALARIATNPNWHHQFPIPRVWYLVEPLYSCEHIDRVGDVVGDGAKFICNGHHLRQQSRCLYYGFGVNGNSEFEDAFLPEFGCESFTFDPTIEAGGVMVRHLQGLGVTHHQWAISSTDAPVNIGGRAHEAYTLGTIREKLGHSSRVVDVFKMDIEGGEWSILAKLLANCDREQPFAHQMQIEFHDGEARQFKSLISRLDECGYRVFYKDMNLWCPHCVELALVHEEFLFCNL